MCLFLILLVTCLPVGRLEIRLKNYHRLLVFPDPSMPQDYRDAR